MHPVLFHIFWIEIQTSVVVIFLWIIFSAIYLEKRVKNNKLLINFISDYFLILTFVFLILWRAWSVFLKWSIYNEDLIRVLYFWDWNFSFYIWMSWVFFFLFFLSILKKEDFRKWLDAIIFPFLFGMLFISFADLMSWNDYWKPSNLPFPFSYTFDSPEVRYAIPIHPVQLYEFVWVFLLFLLLKYFSRKKRITWVVSLLWLSTFFLIQFWLEFLRASSDKMFFWYKFHILLFLVWFFISLIALIFKSHRNFHFHINH